MYTRIIYIYIEIDMMVQVILRVALTRTPAVLGAVVQAKFDVVDARPSLDSGCVRVRRSLTC